MSLGILLAVCGLLTVQSFGEARRGGYVRGYTRKDGTRVNGYYRGGSSSGGSYSSGTGNSYSDTSKTFSSCAAARAAGYNNMVIGSAGYSSNLDGDGDGVACESGATTSSNSASVGNLPKAQYGGLVVRHTTTKLNLRSAPSTSASRLAVINPNVDVNVIGCSAGWCNVEVQGYTGFVSQQYLR